MRFLTLKKSLLSLSLALSAVGCKTIESAPEHDQYAYRMERGFYGVNSKTGKRTKRALNDRYMENAQCLPLGQYEQMEDYIDYLIREAQRRCN